jgi:hypothetical protein
MQGREKARKIINFFFYGSFVALIILGIWAYSYATIKRLFTIVLVVFFVVFFLKFVLQLVWGTQRLRKEVMQVFPEADTMLPLEALSAKSGIDSVLIVRLGGRRDLYSRSDYTYILKALSRKSRDEGMYNIRGN